jgi:F-type H+-transporting ATPase subunit epsilon
MDTFELLFLGNTKIIFEGQAVSLSLPTEKGRMQILAHHQPMIASVTLGESFIFSEANELHVTHGTGIVSIETGRVVVLVLEAHFPDKLTKEHIQEAKRKASEMLETTKTPGRKEKAMRSFRRALLDESVLSKRHK